MALQDINLGTSPLGTTGNTLRAAWTKQKEMNTEIFEALEDVPTLDAENSFTEVNSFEGAVRATIPVAHVAKSIRQKWEYRGPTLVAPHESNGEPEIYYDSAAGLFRMFVYQNSGIYLFTSTSPTGPFTVVSKVIGGGAGPTGGWVGLAGRTSLFVTGGVYYLFFSDLTQGANGSIHYATSPDGVTFTYVGQKLAYNAVGGNNGWNSIQFLQDGATIRILVEGDGGVLNSYNRWRQYYYTASSITGTWTIQNGGLPLNSLLLTGDTTAQNVDSHTSPGPTFKVNGKYYTISHLSGFAIHDSSSYANDDGTEFYASSSTDFLRWAKPRMMIDRADAPIGGGEILSQIADGTFISHGGVQYFYCTRSSIGSPNNVVCFSFNGSLADLFEPEDYNQFAGEVVSKTPPADGNLMRYIDGQTREWQAKGGWDAIGYTPPISTATSAGVTSPVTAGTFLFVAANNWFRKDVDTVIYYDYPTSRWVLFCSGSNWFSTGTSETNPAGTYAPEGPNTGTATVTFAPATTTQQGIFASQGDPNYIAPMGNIHVRTLGAGAGRTLFINELGTAVWFKVGSQRYDITKLAVIDEARTANTGNVPSADSILTGFSLEANKTYRFELNVSFSCTPLSACGYSAVLNYSGTAGFTGLHELVGELDGVEPVMRGEVRVSGTPNSSGRGFVGDTWNWHVTGHMATLTSGSFGFRWSEFNGTTDTKTRRSGSFLRVSEVASS